MQCPLCNTEIGEVVADVACPSCQRTWYPTGWPEAPIASRPKRVTMTKLPEEGDKYTEVFK